MQLPALQMFQPYRSGFRSGSWQPVLSNRKSADSRQVSKKAILGQDFDILQLPAKDFQKSAPGRKEPEHTKYQNRTCLIRITILGGFRLTFC